jgi:putative photosynthetic complex assembly protein
MSGHHHNESLPKAALVGAASLVGITLALTGAVGLGIIDRPVTMQQERVATRIAQIAHRDLQFLDQKDGSVLIRDVGTNRTASTIDPGSKSGFIRGVMRGAARDRHLRGLGPEAPFRLTLWANSDLSLTDSATGRVIELNGFGDTNRDAFMALLPAVPQRKVALR